MPSKTPKIVVLLGTYNGAKRLQAQLDSYVAQTLQPGLILVSDDGSSDSTLKILQDFTQESGIALQIMEGPRRGFAANFLHLIKASPSADMVAFSDQDDVWHADKLARQWAAFGQSNAPMLLGTRTWITNATGERQHLSGPMNEGPDFAHALAQNFAGGNTLALNPQGLELAQRAAHQSAVPVAHDWWLYQLFTGAGADVQFLDVPTVDYIQHTSNLMGENRSLWATLRRLGDLNRGVYKQWADQNGVALDSIFELLAPENRALYQRYRAARDAPFFIKLKEMRAIGVRRRGRLGTAMIYLALAVGKF